MNLSVLPFSAVLFDLDNTLLDREAGFELFCRELYRTNPVMSQSHSEEDAIALLHSWDLGGLHPRLWSGKPLSISGRAFLRTLIRR